MFSSWPGRMGRYPMTFSAKLTAESSFSAACSPNIAPRVDGNDMLWLPHMHGGQTPCWMPNCMQVEVQR
jgi:hypothetical protein